MFYYPFIEKSFLISYFAPDSNVCADIFFQCICTRYLLIHTLAAEVHSCVVMMVLYE
jgi:hypothetical protein